MKKDKEFWDTYSFCIRSEIRRKVLVELVKKPMYPKELSTRLGIYPSHVSRALRELEGKNVLVCLNPDAKKGRIYKLTDLGKQIAEWIKK